MADQEGLNQDQMVDAGIDEALATRYIDETLEQDPELSPFLELFQRAGLRGYLHGPDLVTLFVPQAGLNDLSSLDEERLSTVLRAHMVGRAITESELRTTTSLLTLEKTDLSISRDGANTRIGDTRIVRADIECTNGVVHLVERPLTS